MVPFGVGDTQLLVRTIREIGITAISCTPSYPAVLERVLAEHFPALRPRDLGLRLGLFGGEAGLDDPEFRRRLEQSWGMKARNANYGVSDVFCNFAGQTEMDNDLHFMALDVLHPELVAPETGAVLPWREGECGELVLTHISRECQPLVRFRTGDIILLTGTGRAACGRTAPRFRVIGRSDDMVVVRGINVFPAQAAGVVHRFGALAGEYRIVLDGAGPYDALPIEVELAEGVSGEGAEQLADAVAAAFQARAWRDRAGDAAAVRHAAENRRQITPRGSEGSSDDGSGGGGGCRGRRARNHAEPAAAAERDRARAAGRAGRRTAGGRSGSKRCGRLC